MNGGEFQISSEESMENQKMGDGYSLEKKNMFMIQT